MGATPVLLLLLYCTAGSQASAILSSSAKLILEQERAHERDLLDDELLAIEVLIAKPKLLPKPTLLPTVFMRILEQERIDEGFLLEQELGALESVREKPKFLLPAVQLILEKERAHESALLKDELDALEYDAEQAGATFLPVLARLTLEQERVREDALLEDELAGLELQNPASSWPDQCAPEQKKQTHTWVENCTLAFIYGIVASVLVLFMPAIIKSKSGK